MTVAQLIEILGLTNPDDVVVIFDADSGQPEAVTGMVYGGEDGIVHLYSDDNS